MQKHRYPFRVLDRVYNTENSTKFNRIKFEIKLSG